jgi:hypothetical protein
VFFSFVILLLIVIGLPFREDVPYVRPALLRSHGPIRTARPLIGVAAVVCVAVIGPVAAFGLNRAIEPMERSAAFDLGPNCTVRRTSPVPNTPRANEASVVCGSAAFDVAWQVFSPHVTAGAIMTARRELTAAVQTESLSESWASQEGDTLSFWRLMQSYDPPGMMGVIVCVDGRPMRPGMKMRLRMAWESVVGAAAPPLLVTVTPTSDWRTQSTQQFDEAEARLRTFLASSQLNGAIGRLAGAR